MNEVRTSTRKNPVLGYVMKQGGPGKFSMLLLMAETLMLQARASRLCSHSVNSLSLG